MGRPNPAQSFCQEVSSSTNGRKEPLLRKNLMSCNPVTSKISLMTRNRLFKYCKNQFWVWKLKRKSRSWNSKFLLTLASPGIEPGSPSLLESGNIEEFHKLLIQHPYFGSSKATVLVKNRGQRPILYFPETPYKTPCAMLQSNPQVSP